MFIKNILVAVPAYNCSSQISRVIKQFVDAPREIFSELLIIDNCSSDNTIRAALTEIKKTSNHNISIFKNSQNYGLGGSHKVAFDYCKKNKFVGVIILHGDDQGNLIDLFPFLIKKNSSFDCLLGSRFMRQSKVSGYSFIRRAGNLVFNFLYSLITHRCITDMGSGLNFYSKKLIDANIHSKMPDDLTFNNAYLLALIASKKKIKFFPISWREEDQISNVKLLSQSLGLMKYLLIYIFAKNYLVSSDLRKDKIKNYESKFIFLKDKEY